MNFNCTSDDFIRKLIQVRIHCFSFFPLKYQLHLSKKRIQHLLGTDHTWPTKIFDTRRAITRRVSKDIPETTTGLQRGCPERQREVIDQKRPVGHPQTVIESDVVANAILKEQQFEGLGAMKAQVVDIDHGFDPLRQLDINAAVVNQDAGIHEVCLSLDLAAPQTRQKTVRLDQSNTSLREANAVAYPERKLPTGEIRIVEDRVEACRSIVGRIAVALRPEKRALEPKIVTIDGSFDGRHIRAHLNSPSCDLVSLVVSKREVVRVREVQTAEMAITADAEITNLDRMWPDVANR